VRIITQDPDARLDYVATFEDLIGDTDSLTTVDIDPDAGLTVEDELIVSGNSAVRFWVSGGDIGKSYRVRITPTTTAGRLDPLTWCFRIRRR
jgi:hypothetical protein